MVVGLPTAMFLSILTNISAKFAKIDANYTIFRGRAIFSKKSLDTSCILYYNSRIFQKGNGLYETLRICQYDDVRCLRTVFFHREKNFDTLCYGRCHSIFVCIRSRTAFARTFASCPRTYFRPSYYYTRKRKNANLYLNDNEKSDNSGACKKAKLLFLL